MSIDPKMITVLEQHSFASMMGSFSVVTFSEGEQRESFAFVDGLPIPFSRFGAILTACLFRHSADIGRNWKAEITESPKIDPLSSFWSKMKLSPSTRDEIDPFHATTMAEKRVRKLVQAECPNKHTILRREELGQLIDRIENELIESLRSPMEVIGLARIYDFPTENKPLVELVERLEQAALLRLEKIKAEKAMLKKFNMNSKNTDTY